MKSEELVLVTGASGFIGARLVERLVREGGLKVRILTAHFGHCARVARFKIEMCQGNLANPDSLARACRGVKTVFHLAYDGSDSRVNVGGTRALARAAAAAGVRRFVHMSTVSVYGDSPAGPLTETSARSPVTDIYSSTKAEAETAVLEIQRETKLPVVVLQPAIVYGPYGNSWTVAPLKRVHDFRVVLPAGGRGVCNAVYVDDVAEACELAARNEGAIGKCFLISGSAPVSWREFYGAYEAMAGVTSVVPMETEAMIEEMRRNQHAPTFASTLLSAIWRRPNIRSKLYRLIPVRYGYRLATIMTPKSVRRCIRTRLDTLAHEADGLSGTAPLLFPDNLFRQLYCSQSVVDIGNARRDLGYEPRFDFGRGMALTRDWARWANLIGTH